MHHKGQKHFIVCSFSVVPGHLDLIHISCVGMNNTESRWPESKHLASFAWGFPWAAQQICTHSKRTKEGVFSAKERRYKRAASCKWRPQLSCDMRPCNKDKVFWEDWSFEVTQWGSDIMLDLVVVLNEVFLGFIVWFMYLIGFPFCCLIRNSSFLPNVLFYVILLTERLMITVLFPLLYFLNLI